MMHHQPCAAPFSSAFLQWCLADLKSSEYQEVFFLKVTILEEEGARLLSINWMPLLCGNNVLKHESISFLLKTEQMMNNRAATGQVTAGICGRVRGDGIPRQLK